MDIGEKPDNVAVSAPPRRPKTDKRYCVLVTLNSEQMAAAEGWRSAHGLTNQAEALGELIRIGLLSEIAKIYRLVSENGAANSGRTRGRAETSKRKSGSKQNLS